MHAVANRFPVIAQYLSIAFDKGMLLVNALVLALNIAINRKCQKPDSSGYIFVADTIWIHLRLV